MRFLLLILSMISIFPLFGQESGKDNISNYYTVENALYILCGDKAIYQDYGQWKIFDVDSASFCVVESAGKSFGIDKNGVYIEGDLVETDTTGFMVFDLHRLPHPQKLSFYWKTNKDVYTNDSVLAQFDAPSFSYIGYDGNYMRDKNGVYYKDEKIEGADTTSFQYDEGAACYRDEKYIYQKGKRLLINGEYAAYVNNSLIKTKSEVYAWDYHYYGTVSENKTECNHIDAQSLQRLSRFFSMDKNNIYYKSNIIAAATDKSTIRCYDAINSSFIVIGNKILNCYIFDSWQEISHLGIDASTFGAYANRYEIMYDKQGAFYMEHNSYTNKLERIDIAFEYAYPFDEKDIRITEGEVVIYKDSQFYKLSKIPGDDEIFENLTLEQDEMLKKGYRISNNENFLNSIFYKYWYGYPLLSNIDAATFEPINPFYFKDKGGVYVYDRDSDAEYIKIGEADKDTFRELILWNGDYFACDQKSVYYKSAILKDISAERIQLLAIFMGYRPASKFDQEKSFDYYLLQNKDGYWLISPTSTEFVGTEYPKEILTKDQSNKRILR